jgi:signal recognition particle receptor subunit beta
MFNNLLTSDFFGRIFNAPAHLVVFAVILGVVYLVLLINFILHLRKVYSKRNKAILLLGPCHSGKTVLFHHLRDGKFVETVTSMKETQEMFPLNEKYWPNTQIDATITLVDYPGHERLRS